MKISVFYKFNKNLFQSRVRKYIKPALSQEYYNSKHYYQQRDKVIFFKIESLISNRCSYISNENTFVSRL